MDSRRAREILIHYRPGLMDAADPRIAEAMEAVQRDPELAAWFDQQCAVYTAIRGRLKAIPIPQDLKRRIIVEHAAAPRIVPLNKRSFVIVLALAALIMLSLLTIVAFSPKAENSFPSYRNRMARMVQRPTYVMQMVTNDQSQIREFFREKGAPVNYVLPTALEKLPGIGGAVLRWHDHQVSLLCLNAADPKNSNERNDLYLFMASSSVLPRAPGKRPEFNRVGKLMTASWTVGDKVYLLAGSGDQAVLAKYLE